MHGVKRTQLLCVICTVCEQPALVCHGPQLPCVRCLRSSIDNTVLYHLWFLGLPSRQRCALAVALHQHDCGLAISHARVFMKYLNALI